MSDVKTLRLASLQLTDELITQFVTYQRALLAALGETAQADWAGRYAFGHARALTQSGLDSLTQQQLKAVCADFCGRRSAWLTVKQRVAEARHRAAEKQASQKDLAIIDRAAAELPALEDLSELGSRYGAAALGLLRKNELELVSLHRELVRAEGHEGHLHA